jgi:hypothetical protein
MRVATGAGMMSEDVTVAWTESMRGEADTDGRNAKIKHSKIMLLKKMF